MKKFSAYLLKKCKSIEYAFFRWSGLRHAVDIGI